MPEAPVNEERRFDLGPREVRLPGDEPMSPVSTEPVDSEHRSHGNLGRLVPRGLHGRHDLRPHSFGNGVHSPIFLRSRDTWVRGIAQEAKNRGTICDGYGVRVIAVVGRDPPYSMTLRIAER